jgi:aminoglycoside 6'-N-acetyltransferase I
LEEIIRVSADSMQECIELYTKVFNDEPWNESWTHEAAGERLLDLLHTPKSLLFSLSSHGRLAGLIGGNCKRHCGGTTFYLAELCIDNKIQGKGYGSKLLTHLERELKSMGVQSIYLLTMNGGQAEAFYNKHGYVLNKNRIVMAKSL